MPTASETHGEAPLYCSYSTFITTSASGNDASRRPADRSIALQAVNSPCKSADIPTYQETLGFNTSKEVLTSNAIHRLNNSETGWRK